MFRHLARQTYKKKQGQSKRKKQTVNHLPVRRKLACVAWSPSKPENTQSEFPAAAAAPIEPVLMIYQRLNLVGMRLIMGDGFPPVGPDLSLLYG